MTSNKNKHIVTNKIVSLRSLFSLHITFLSSSEITVEFNILFSNANTNLPNNSFYTTFFYYLNNNLL